MRGQILRARDRDQRLVGARSASLAARVCMGTPLARAYHAPTAHFQPTSRAAAFQSALALPRPAVSIRTSMSNSAPIPQQKKAATTASIVLAFATLYFFWGSTYAAIRIGAAQMPAFLLSGTRNLIAGGILLAWCRWRGFRIVWPLKTMLTLGLIGFCLLSIGNVCLIQAETTVPSGLASLLFAAIPLYVALVEVFLPGGEPLSARGWLGMALGFAGMIALVWPSLRSGFSGDHSRLISLAILLGGAFAWAIGILVARHARLPVNSFVAASWQMLLSGAISTVLGTTLGEWPRFHVNAASIGAQAYLITGGSLLGYSAFVYLVEHVPLAKVTSYAYVNPLVAVLLGIVLLHERPVAAEFAGMAAILVAVFLLTSAQVNAKPGVVEALEQLPAE